MFFNCGMCDISTLFREAHIWLVGQKTDMFTGICCFVMVCFISSSSSGFSHSRKTQRWMLARQAMLTVLVMQCGSGLYAWLMASCIVIISRRIEAGTTESQLAFAVRSANGSEGTPLPYASHQSCVYLDYNATSPIFPEVTQEMLPYIGERFGNPSSTHFFGNLCKGAVEVGRMRVSSLLGCNPTEIVFTGTGSEADNHAIVAALDVFKRQRLPSRKPHIVSSAVEHPAISVCLNRLVKDGKADVTYVGVDSNGIVSVQNVKEAIRENTALVTIMHSNNEVGSLQPIKRIANECRSRGVLCHTDAAQSIGKVLVKVESLGIDMLTIVGHKFGAPKGIAALFVRKGLDIPPLIVGGGQEGGKRAGTENVLLIAGMGRAAEVVNKDFEALATHLALMRDRLELKLREGFMEGIERLGRVITFTRHGPSDPLLRLPNTLSVGIEGLNARELLDKVSTKVAASAGSACHSGRDDISGVLKAMGVSESLGMGTLRLSVGRHTTSQEVDSAAALITRQAKNLLAS